MIKKEVRIFLTVVLAVAFVSLVTQIISGLASAIMQFTDIKEIKDPDYIKYYDMTTGFTLGLTLLSIVFVLGIILSFVLKMKKRAKVIMCSVLYGTLILAFIAFAVSLRVTIPFSTSYFGNKHISTTAYEYFQQFLMVGLADAIASILVYVSWLMLTVTRPKEQSAEENKSISD